MICKRQMHGFWNRTLVAFAVLGMLAFGACQKQIMVERRGVMVPIDDAARADFELYDSYAQAGKDREAIVGFKKMLGEYQQSSFLPRIHLSLGRLYLKRKLPVEATKQFNILIEKFPSSDFTEQAKFYYGNLLLANGKQDEALSLLESIHIGKVDLYLQTRVYQSLKQIYAAKNQSEQLFWANIELYRRRQELIRQNQAAAKPGGAVDSVNVEDVKLREEVVAYIDAAGTQAELDKIADRLPRNDDPFPNDFIKIRQAKLAYQIGDFDRTKRLLNEFLGAYRDQGMPHERTKEAEEILGRLNQMGVARKDAIGVLLPLSGSYEAVGRKILAAILMGAELFNEKAGGVPVELFVRDTANDADQTVRAFEDMVVQDQVVAVIGPVLKKDSQAAASRADYFGVPMISMAQEEGLTGNSPFVFQNALSKADQVAALADFIVNKMSMKRLAALYPQHAYGTDLFAMMGKQIATYPEVEFKRFQTYSKEDNDFGAPIKALVGLDDLIARRRELCPPNKNRKKNQPAPTNANGEPLCFDRDNLPPITAFEGLFIPDSFEKMRQIAPSLTFYGVQGIQLLGTHLWHNRELLKEGTVEHMNGAVFVDGFDPESNSPQVKEFVEKFRAEFGEEPDTLAAQAFDTVQMLRAAVAQGVADRDGMRRYISNLSDWNGLTGKISFGPEGKAKRQALLFTVDGDRFRTIGVP